MVIKTNLESAPNAITKDGIEIQVLLHPLYNGNANQSLGQGTIQAGYASRLHKHLTSEAAYYILSGSGKMKVGAETFPVTKGDTIAVMPSTWYKLEADADADLIFICALSPGYMPEDTAIAAETPEE